MTQLAADLLSVSQTGLAVGFIVFLRVGAAMAVLPAFGERSIPMRVRLGLALAFTVIVAPVLFDRIAPLALPEAPKLPLLGAEVAAGLCLGLALRLFILALQTAGSIAAQSTSLSQILGGGGVEPQPAFAHIMVISGLALLVMTGLHVRVAEALIGSYDVLPPGLFPSPSIVADWGSGQVARAFALAFTLSAPFVIASFLYNLTLGVINKAMPQLMVAFVGAPAITAGGLILLFLSLPVLLGFWRDQVELFLASPFGSAG
ncbi:MAG: flagellar biosynthetic protein FliR [Rhodobacter sp.]|nr:flagellar biosynthetic protein FliR [Rhodobacter sp.]